MSAAVDRWASTPVRWAATAAGIGIVMTLVAAPHATGYAAAAGVALVVLVLGGQRFMREQRPAGQADPAADQPACAGCPGCGGPDCIGRPDPASAAGRACRCAGVGFGGKGDCPVHNELTAEEARALVDDLGLQLYRAEDAIAFVGECCDIADREQQPVTTAHVREWLKGAQCARQAGLVLGPDASGQDPDPIRTTPDTTGQQTADQGGHDPDALRTRLAAAIWERQNPGRKYADCAPPWNADAESDADVVLAELAPELARAERAEAEAARWLAFIERGLDTHMSFGVINPDGTTEQLPCADWCHACRVERAEAALGRVRELADRMRHPRMGPIAHSWAAEVDAALAALTPPTSQPKEA